MGLENLTNILDTVAIGFIVLILMLAFFWVFSKKNESFFTFLKTHSDLVQGNAMLAVSLTLSVFITGIITQQLSDYLTDSEFKRQNPILEILGGGLKDEKHHRFQTLFCGEKLSFKCSDDSEYGLTSLGKEVFSYKNMLYSIAFPGQKLLDVQRTEAVCVTSANSDELQDKCLYDLITNPKKYINSNRLGNKETTKLKSIVGQVYYKAKNWSYMQREYRMELSDLQRRLDFSRSAATVLFFYTGLLIVCLLYMIIPDETKISINHQGQTGALEYIRRALFVIFICVFSFIATCFSYERAENNFNERVFGYYFTYLGDYTIHNGRCPNKIYRKMSDETSCVK